MNFNLEAQEVLFSRKLLEVTHPKLFFSNSDIAQTNSQKQFGVVLDSKLKFHDYFDIVFTKLRQTISLLHKRNSILHKATLVTIFKFFVRPW